MKREDIHKVLIIGSGPIIIGQACEFDYSGTQACKALKKLGYEIVLVNSNPATIMTDPDTADITYIEPLNVERLEQIIEKERPDALLPNLGGQSGLNLCAELNKAGVLDKYNVKVIGVQVDAIERGEDRIEFKRTMNELGIEMARSEVAVKKEEELNHLLSRQRRSYYVSLPFQHILNRRRFIFAVKTVSFPWNARAIPSSHLFSPGSLLQPRTPGSRSILPLLP